MVNQIINSFLNSNNLDLIQINENYLKNNLGEIKTFVNNIILEHKDKYNWELLDDEYFINPLINKFNFSYLLKDNKTNKIVFINFSSQYNDLIHSHFWFCHPNYRGKNLARIITLNLTRVAKQFNLTKINAYWPINNKGSLILFMKLGFIINDLIKNKTQIVMESNVKNLEINIINSLNL